MNEQTRRYISLAVEERQGLALNHLHAYAESQRQLYDLSEAELVEVLRDLLSCCADELFELDLAEEPLAISQEGGAA